MLFAVVQYPLADSRVFLGTDAARLARPDWLTPSLYADFVRAFGNFRPRGLGSVVDWPGEGFYCDASRALRLVPPKAPLIVEGSGMAFRYECVFRRLIADASPCARVEIGLRLTPRSHGILQPKDLPRLVSRLLDTSVRIGSSGSSVRLVHAGPQLALAYLDATTDRASEAAKPKQNWWVTAGNPLVFVEHDERLTGAYSEELRAVPTPNLTGVSLRHAWLQHGNSGVHVWVLGRAMTAPRETLRSIRVGLGRLHVEREVFRSVLAHVRANRLPLERGTSESNNVQSFLSDSVNYLGRRERFGLPQSKLVEQLTAVDDLVAPQDRAALMRSLQSVRGNLRSNISKMTIKGRVLLVHGIRTEAAWAEMVKAVLEEKCGVQAAIVKLGYVDALMFIFPFLRGYPVKRLSRALAYLRNKGDAPVSVIAHSFGTWCLTHIMEDEPTVSLEHVILCGAIVPQRYRWDGILPRVKGRVVNDCGTLDIWPVLSHLAAFGTGPTGTTGIGFPDVHDRYHALAHSGFFTEPFVRDFWVPVILSGTIAPSPLDKTRATPPAWRSLLASDLAKWTFRGAVTAGAVAAVVLAL